jgi:hypothetical protein
MKSQLSRSSVTWGALTVVVVTGCSQVIDLGGYSFDGGQGGDAGESSTGACKPGECATSSSSPEGSSTSSDSTSSVGTTTSSGGKTTSSAATTTSSVATTTAATTTSSGGPGCDLNGVCSVDEGCGCSDCAGVPQCQCDSLPSCGACTDCVENKGTLCDGLCGAPCQAQVECYLTSCPGPFDQACLDACTGGNPNPNAMARLSCYFCNGCPQACAGAWGC